MARLRKIFNIYAVERASLEGKSIEEIRTIVGNEFRALDEEAKLADRARVVEVERQMADLRARLDRALAETAAATASVEPLRQTVAARDRALQEQGLQLAASSRTIEALQTESAAKEEQAFSLQGALSEVYAADEDKQATIDALRAEIETQKENARKATGQAQEYEALLETEKVKVC